MKDFHRIISVEALQEYGNTLYLKFGIVFFYIFFGNSIIKAVVPMLLVHSLYLIGLFTLLNLVKKINTKDSISLSFLFFGLATIPLVAFSSTKEIIYLASWSLLIALGKTFLHTASILTQGVNTSHKHRGTELMKKHIAILSVAAVVPLTGGLISEYYGLTGLSIAAAFTFLVAIFLSRGLKNFKLKFSSKNLKAILKTPQIKRLIALDFMYEFQNVPNRLWPIYIFLILGEGFKKLGMFLFAVIVLNAVLTFALDKALDKFNRKLLMGYSFLGTAVTWGLRAASTNPLFLLFADTLHSFTDRVTSNTVDVINFDLMNDNLDIAIKDEAILIRELTFNLAAVFSFAIMAITINYFGFSTAFSIISVFSFAAAIVVKHMKTS